MRPLPKYLPDDQRKHLGDPPWRQNDDAVLAWEHAHNHDPRTKCLVEYGCQALADHYDYLLEAYERERDEEVPERRHGDVITNLRPDLDVPPRHRTERDRARVTHVALAISREWNRTPDGDPLGIDLAQAALDAADEWEYP